MKDFNAKEEKDKIVQFIRDYYEKHDLGGVVIGISGGKDSAVVSGLFTEALGAENVLGVTLPCHSKDSDRNDAKLVADKFGFNLINVNLTEVYNTFKDEINKLGNFTEEDLKNSDINIRPRLRMATLYYLAALYSEINKKPYIVTGTGNKSEFFVGYFTKGGDNVSDISVIGDLTVEEVIKVGEVLGVPEKVLYKTPDDGLSGMSDEVKLGFSYVDVDKVINGEEVDNDVKKRILRRHEDNQHKFGVTTYRKDS